jgi:hypothetical protein
VDQANSSKSRGAAHNTGNAADETGTSRTWYAGDKTVHREAEHTSCAPTETRTAEHSTGADAESTEADADAAFYAARETDTGNEAGSAFESVDSARAKSESAGDAAVAAFDASGHEAEPAVDTTDNSTRSRTWTGPGCECAHAIANIAASDYSAEAAAGRRKAAE